MSRTVADAGQPAKPQTAFPEARVYEPALRTGGRAQKVRERIGYETNVPRCDNCKHFRSARLVLANSLPHHFPSRCVLHEIRVQHMGICDT